MTTARQFWVGSATRDHVQQGVEGGFCQLSHGRPEPLRKMGTGDWLAYYSARESWDTRVPCQRFTALGRVSGDEIYQVAMANGFHPFRRDVNFCRASEVAVKPLIAELSFIHNKKFWGLPFRRGYFQVSEADFRIIAEAMLGRPFKETMRCGKKAKLA